MLPKEAPKELQRGFVFVKGYDAWALLQSLLTCDVQKNKVSYGFLLTPNGRFLFDIFVVPFNDGYLLDVFNKEDFIKKLTRYRLNRNVIIEDYPGYMGWFLEEPVSGIYYKEPRFEGFRAVLKKPPMSLHDYHVMRIQHGVSDAPWDLIPEKSIILDHNLPENAISYDKGCYVGQELIARTHYTGVLRKKMIPFKVAKGTVQSGDELENSEGTVYSVVDNFTLVMIRDTAWDKTELTTQNGAVLSLTIS